MTDQVTTDVTAREIAHEQAFVDVRLPPARGVHPQRGGAGPGGARPRPARPRGRPGRARRDGLPGGQADRHPQRRPRGAGLRPARPQGPDRGAPLHRPDRAPRRLPRHPAHRLARPGGGGVLPGDARRAAGRRTPPGAAVLRPHASSASRTTCSTPRPARTCRWSARARCIAQLSRARDRSMHSIVATIQAEQDRAIRAPSRGVVEISGGPGHRQDRGRAAPRGVPALHRPGPLRARRRARRRPVRGLHALHRARAAVAGRDRGGAALARRGGRRRPGDPPRRRRRSPTSRARPRMAELLRRTARQAVPGAPREFRVLLPRRRRSCLHRRDLGRIRRGLLAQGKRNKQTHRVASALVDALWRQVRGERALERGREEFVDTMLGDDRSCTFVRDWWPPLDATEVLGWLRDPELLARVGEGVLERRRPAGPQRRRGPTRTSRWRTSRWSTSCATSSATPPSRRRGGAGPARPPRRREHARADHDHRPGVHRAADREPHRGRRLRPRPRRRGAGPDPDAVADGRPARPRPRPGRSSATRRSPPGRSRRRPPRRARRRSTVDAAAAPRSRHGRRRQHSTWAPTTATARRSTATPRRTPSGSGSPPTCPTPCARPASSRSRRSSTTSRTASARRPRELLAEVDGTVGIVVPVARRERGGRLARLVAGGWPARSPAATPPGRSSSPGWTPRGSSSTGSSWWSRRRSSGSRRPGGRRSTSC